LRSVGAYLDVVWPAPDLVPLGPVRFIDDLAVAIEHVDHVLPSPVNAGPAIASISRGFAAARCGAGGFACRQAAADGELDARPNLRKPGGPAPQLKDRQLALLRHEDTVGTFGKDVSGLRPGPCLMVGKALTHWPRPVGHRIVGTERVLSAFETRHGGEALPGRFLLLSFDNAHPVA